MGYCMKTTKQKFFELKNDLSWNMIICNNNDYYDNRQDKNHLDQS